MSDAATPVTLTPLQAAWRTFCTRVHANQPRELRADNPPSALSGRACDLDAQIIAATDWIVAMIEDTAQHIHIDGRSFGEMFRGQMTDMAGDLRGALVEAIHRNAA